MANVPEHCCFVMSNQYHARVYRLASGEIVTIPDADAGLGAILESMERMGRMGREYIERKHGKWT